MAAPPLLALPVELQLQIIGELELQDQALLALTCRTFAGLIKQPSLENFLAAEKGPWASNRNLFTCKECKQFRRLLDFADTMRTGKHSRGNAEAQSRLCIACGIDQDSYTPGTQLEVMGTLYTVRHPSQILNSGRSGPGRVGHCLQLVRETHVRDHSEHEIDWDYSVPKHSDELYERWQHV